MALLEVREELRGLPGAEIVEQGLRDLQSGVNSEAALLTLSAGPRLRRLGLTVPLRADIQRPCEHRLYEHLQQTHGRGAYSRYNSLLRRIVSFARAMEHRNRRQFPNV